jgi:hypothetical protein
MTPARARAIAALGARRIEEKRQDRLRSREEFADRVAGMAATIERLERENRAQRQIIQHQERQLSMRPSSALDRNPTRSIRAAGDGLDLPQGA